MVYNETYHKRQELLGEEGDYAGETGNDDQRTAGSKGDAVFKPICKIKQRFRRKKAGGKAMRSSPGLSKRQRPYSALQIISQTEAEDAGIFASQGGSLQDEAYTYTGGVSKCKNDREGAALK